MFLYFHVEYLKGKMSVSGLIHIIYSSSAAGKFTAAEVRTLLDHSQRRNRELGITGILLYTQGSFLQVIEGEEETIDAMFARIRSDTRHHGVTLIIREAVSRRSFPDWSMGYAELSASESEKIPGMNDFFSTGKTFADLNHGRAKKILKAFREGRWRARVSDLAQTPASPTNGKPGPNARFSFAFQPIIDVTAKEIFSYEALIRGGKNETAQSLLESLGPAGARDLDRKSGIQAIELAADLGLAARINLNMLPVSLEENPAILGAILNQAERREIAPERIIIEILEKEIIRDPERFAAAVHQFRGAGLQFAIDDFGSGHAGLSLLAEFQPDLIKLDMALVRNIHSHGPRQAIVKGIVRTSLDLGIDVVAEGVEMEEEFNWLKSERIALFQGFLLARPAFEALPETFYLPKEPG